MATGKGIPDPDDPDNEEEKRYWCYVSFAKEDERGESTQKNFKATLHPGGVHK